MKKSAIIVFSLIFIIIMAAGCQTAARKPTTPDNNKPLSESQKNVMGNRLANIAENVKGVKNATVIVTEETTGVSVKTPGTTGNNINRTPVVPQNMSTLNKNLVAMVGLTLDTSIKQDKQKLGTIEKEVATRIKNSDRRIGKVMVTTQPDLVKRINNVTQSFKNGKPIQKDIVNLTREMSR